MSIRLASTLRSTQALRDRQSRATEALSHRGQSSH